MLVCVRVISFLIKEFNCLTFPFTWTTSVVCPNGVKGHRFSFIYIYIISKSWSVAFIVTMLHHLFSFFHLYFSIYRLTFIEHLLRFRCYSISNSTVCLSINPNSSDASIIWNSNNHQQIATSSPPHLSFLSL